MQQLKGASPRHVTYAGIDSFETQRPMLFWGKNRHLISYEVSFSFYLFLLVASTLLHLAHTIQIANKYLHQELKIFNFLLFL